MEENFVADFNLTTLPTHPWLLGGRTRELGFLTLRSNFVPTTSLCFWVEQRGDAMKVALWKDCLVGGQWRQGDVSRGGSWGYEVRASAGEVQVRVE